MAIKISGNTIIDDSRNLTANTITATTFTGNAASITSIPDFLQVLAPTNVSPSDGATDQSLTPTLEVSAFQSTAGSTHANTQFQLSTVSNFTSTVVDTCTGANNYALTVSSLSDNTEHFFRARHIDNNGCCSAFSTATSFTTENVISTLGEPVCGGFYMGTICAAGSCYYLIMAPNATGCACCQFGAYADDGIDGELCDGYGNTYDHLTNSTDRAGNWTATRTIGGFSDWYLPAGCELEQLYCNEACVDASEQFVAANYWSSTESLADCRYACYFRFNVGDLRAFYGGKDRILRVRAIRRVPF